MHTAHLTLVLCSSPILTQRALPPTALPAGLATYRLAMGQAPSGERLVRHVRSSCGHGLTPTSRAPEPRAELYVPTNAELHRDPSEIHAELHRDPSEIHGAHLAEA